MTRLVLVTTALLTGAATAAASIAPPPMYPYRNPPPYAGTQQVAALLPFAAIAGEPAVLTVRSLQSITVFEPGGGGPCGNPDRFSMPSSGSAERVAALRTGFMAMTRDAGFLTEASKVSLDVSPSSGEEVQAFVTRIYASPRAIVERAKDALRLDQ